MVDYFFKNTHTYVNHKKYEYSLIMYELSLGYLRGIFRINRDRKKQKITTYLHISQKSCNFAADKYTCVYHTIYYNF